SAVAQLVEAGVRDAVSLAQDDQLAAACERAGIGVHRVNDPARPEHEAAADAVVQLYRARHQVALDLPENDARLGIHLPTYPYEREIRWPTTTAATRTLRLAARAFVREWNPLDLGQHQVRPERGTGRTVLLAGPGADAAQALAQRL